MNRRLLSISLISFLLISCGGGGGSAPAPDPAATVSLSANNSEVEIGSPVMLSWSSTNAQTCLASGNWSGAKAVSGSEEIIINQSGMNSFNLTCSGESSSSNASVVVNGVIPRIDITNDIFSNRSSDCADYDENYRSSVRDLTRVIDFEGYLDIEASEEYCDIYSDNIPNHDFNDSSANFAHNAIEVERVFRVKRFPEQASQNTEIRRNTWDALMLNGVVVDLKSAGCYSPSSPNANADGNIAAGCGQSAQWNLVPLEYTSMFGVDLHNAHVQGDGTYHYHGNPNAMFDDNPSGDGSPFIGFAADGFPIYGTYILDDTTGLYRKVISGYSLKEGSRGTQSNTNPGGAYTGIYEEDWEWTDAGDLDECNGMTYKGQYGYYVTDRYPYIINCFKGTIDSSFSK
ncbi:MAG: YHYH protein [Gammaproteobacteria bacterium]